MKAIIQVRLVIEHTEEVQQAQDSTVGTLYQWAQSRALEALPGNLLESGFTVVGEPEVVRVELQQEDS